MSRNDISGYTVISFLLERVESRLVAFLPVMPCAGERFDAEGDWIDHHRYGRQFRAATFTVAAPAASEELITFLSSGLLPGIGKSLAFRIVSRFGEDVLRVLQDRPVDLLTVEGIGASKLAGVIEAWKKHYGLRDVAKFLSPHGFSLSLSGRVWYEWADEALGILTTQPYRLYTDFTGASFHLVDRMALKQGTARDHVFRCEAGLTEAMRSCWSDGHTGIPRNRLVDRAKKLLEIAEPPITAALNGLITLGEMAAETWSEGEMIFIPSMRKAEEDLTERLAALRRGKSLLGKFARSDVITALAKRRAIGLSPSQLEALHTLFVNPVAVLTGGPGTGKTRLTQLITDAARAAEIPIMLAAPTGRAACRLEESTGLPAQTIHRLLAYNPSMERFQRHSYSPLPAGLVLVDEASMVDLPLAAHLLRAVADGSQLILVGDAHQLPSVGPGSVLNDVISTMPQSTAHLAEIHRQRAGSWIVKNAHRMLKGEPLQVPPRGAKGDFSLRQASTTDEVLATLSRTLDQLAERGVPVHQVQVLAGTRKGPLGTTALNRWLQERFVSAVPDAPTTHGLRVGDRVVQTSNDYEREVFNGSLGAVTSLNMEEKVGVVTFDDKPITYAFAEMDSLELAWAMTVHKSQGGEFPVVLCVVHRAHGPVLSRNLIYTAMTRARSWLVLIGEKEAVEVAQKNAARAKRLGAFRERLAKLVIPSDGRQLKFA